MTAARGLPRPAKLLSDLTGRVKKPDAGRVPSAARRGYWHGFVSVAHFIGKTGWAFIVLGSSRGEIKCRCGEMADAQDLKSWDHKKSCGFESHHRHQYAGMLINIGLLGGAEASGRGKL